MSLIGISNEEKTWNYFMSKLNNEFGVSGLMGNLYSESGFRPDNLQNTFEKKLGMTDEEYTKSVDNGSYTNFIHDGAGYGLAQWTYWSRKQNLLNYAHAKNKSIGDLEMQLDFLWGELQAYTSVIHTLKTATSVLEASNVVLLQYERPKDQSVLVQIKRANFGLSIYSRYVEKIKVESEVKSMSNSSLATIAVMSPNHSGKRNHAIDRITPHCFVGQVTVERGLAVFASKSRRASCQYVIGKDGRVGLSVDEANRSWCTSSSLNDNRAVTIECASDTKDPYAFNDAVYSKLVDLCEDICRRNGKNRLIWIPNKTQALAYTLQPNEMLITVHRWFANKSWPGDWLYNRLGDVASIVNRRLSSVPTAPTPTPSEPPKSKVIYKVQLGAYSVKSNADKLLTKVKKAGFSAFITKVGSMYKVQVGAYSNKSNADAMLNKLKKAGFNGFIVQSKQS